MISGKLQVFFEEPFWVGIFEHVENGKLACSKKTDAGNWYRHKITAGIETAAGTEQTGAEKLSQ